MDLLDSIKDSADDLVSKLDKGGHMRSALDGLRRQMAESDARRLVKTLEKEVESLRLQIEQKTQALGVQTLGLYQSGGLANTELHTLCKHILDVQTLLNTREKELEQAQAELAKLLSPSQPVSSGAGGSPAPLVGSPTPPTSNPCPHCGEPLPFEGDFCPHCGKKASAGAAKAEFCAFCGAELKPNSKFCPQCGKQVP